MKTIRLTQTMNELRKNEFFSFSYQLSLLLGATGGGGLAQIKRKH